MELIDLRNLTPSDAEFYKEIVKDQTNYRVDGIEYVMNQLNSTETLVLEEMLDTKYALTRKLNRSYLGYNRGQVLTREVIDDLITNNINTVYVKKYSFGEQEVIYLKQLCDLYRKNLLDWSGICSLLDSWLSNYNIATGESIDSGSVDGILGGAIKYPNDFYPISYIKFEPTRLGKYLGVYSELPDTNLPPLPGTPIVEPPALGLKELLKKELEILKTSIRPGGSGSPVGGFAGLSSPDSQTHKGKTSNLEEEYKECIEAENSCISNLNTTMVSLSSLIISLPSISPFTDILSFIPTFTPSIQKLKDANNLIGSSYMTWFNPSAGMGFNFQYMQSMMANQNSGMTKDRRIRFIEEFLASDFAIDIRIQPFFDVIYENRWYWLCRLINRVYGVYASLYRRLSVGDIFKQEKEDLTVLLSYIEHL